MRFDISTRDLFPFFFLRFGFSFLSIHFLVSVVVMYEYRGAMKIKGSLSAAQKFTPDIFPKPSKM
jgi:hypothetical protein